MKSSLRTNLVLLAVVASEEDKGYQMNVGLSDVKGFLPSKETGGRKLVVGQPLLTLLTRVEGSEEGGAPRAVILSADGSRLSSRSVCVVPDGLQMEQLTPGTILATSLVEADKNGMRVQLAPGLVGEVPTKQLPPQFRADPSKLVDVIASSGDSAKSRKAAGKGKGGLSELVSDGQVRVLVTAARPNSSFLCLSSSPHLMRLGATDGRAGSLSNAKFGLGAQLSLEVGRVSARGAVHLELPSEARQVGLVEAVVGVEQLELPAQSKKTREDIALRYSVGSKHKVRITGVRIMDGVLLCTTKGEILKQKIVSLEEAEPGMLFKAAKVARLSPQGIHVLLYDRLKGFVPNLHTADRPLMEPGKTLKEGAKLGRLRVLYFDKERRQLILTRKATLVDSNLPIISSFSTNNVGITTVGMVFKVLPCHHLVPYRGSRHSTPEHLTLDA